MPAKRDYEVVLLGATGFTGRLVAEHLSRRLSGTGVSWAVAGRNPDKLADVTAGLQGDIPRIEVVDVGDVDALIELARRTRALATTVGPFAQLGEPVVEACVRAGTHYADITGEPQFVNRVRERYHADAKAAGVKLVSCCGFDSVPSDLGVRFTVGHLPDDAPLSVRGYVSANAAPSGGTVQSAIGAMADLRMPLARIAGNGGREVRALPMRLHRLDPVAGLTGYGVPFPVIDVSIVLRSGHVLDGYGSSFRYGHFLRVRRLPVVVGVVAGAGALAALANIPPARKLLERVLPSSGEGPPAEKRARSYFSVTFVGSGGGHRVITQISGGDPGYDETARMLGEAVLSLAQDEGPDVAGAVTPAVGLGSTYHQRLVDQGLRFELLSTG